MSKTEKGFVMLPNAAQEDKRASWKLANLWQLPPTTTDIGEFTEIYNHLVNKSQIRSSLEAARLLKSYQKYFGGREMSSDVRGNIMMFMDEHTDKLQYATYGIFMHEYMDELAEQKRNHPSHKPHTSLLVGVQPSIGVSEYNAAVSHIHPNSQRLIVDLVDREASKKAKDYHGHFIKGDAFSLPFRGIDSIHTNLFLTYLLENHGRVDNHEPIQLSAQEQKARFFKGSFDALNPNGILIMCESNTFTQADTRGDLRDVGFTNISTRTATQFKTRRDLARFMSGSTSEPDIKTLKFSPSKSIITAQKPAK